MTPSAPTQEDHIDVGSYKILIENKVINGEYQVVSINVQAAFNKITYARINILDGDPAKQIFKISDQESAFTPGKKIEIKLGYHGKDFSVFQGIIIRHSIRSKKLKQSYLSIEAKENAVKLSVGRQNRSFYKKSDSEIIDLLVSNLGLSLDIESLSYKHPEMIQHYSTDWDFILLRAENNGMLVLTHGGGLTIKKPKILDSPKKKFRFGLDEIYEVEACVDARSQFKKIVSQSWNPKTQKIESVEAEEKPLPELGKFDSAELFKAIGLEELLLSHTGVMADEELKSWSNAYQTRSILAKAIGRIKVQGMADLVPGDTIELSGLGNKFNGKVLVCAVYQQFTVSNWETDIQFGMSLEPTFSSDSVMEVPASGLVPGINGLQIGIVMKLENDPDGEDRVQVRIPFIDHDEGIWARVVCLDAGKDRGSFFRPEINDEVMLGFINNDPRGAIILGMLNSSSKPAPLKGSDQNNKKGFITRSGLKVIFDDDQKSILINSPNGKTILIDDQKNEISLEDQNSNKVVMNNQGISIESGKDIQLKASSGEIKIIGMKITQSASAEYSAEGNASVSIKSSGISELKGSMVKIN